MNRIRALALLLVWLSVTAPAQEQKRDVEAGYRGSRYSFREYRPKTFRQLKELPPEVLANLSRHLEQRLGTQFYTKLEFSWGEAIDLNELHSVEPYWRNERVGSYDLVFSFSDRAKGLKAFYSKVVLDARGDIVEEINLPDIASQPQKMNLIPSTEALRIAAQTNFVGKKIWPSFDYYADTDSFVWIIEDSDPVTEKGACPSESDSFMSLLSIGFGGPYRRLFIEAHSGHILKHDCYRIAV